MCSLYMQITVFLTMTAARIDHNTPSRLEIEALAFHITVLSPFYIFLFYYFLMWLFDIKQQKNK